MQVHVSKIQCMTLYGMSATFYCMSLSLIRYHLSWYKQGPDNAYVALPGLTCRTPSNPLYRPKMSFYCAFIVFFRFLLSVQLPMIFFAVSRHAELILWPLPVLLGSALLKPFSFFRFWLCLSILSPLDLLSMVSIIRFGLFLSAIICTSIFLPHFCFSFSAWFDMYDGFLLFTHKNKPKGSTFFVLNVVCCLFSPWFGMYDGFFCFFRTKTNQKLRPFCS